MLEDKLTNQRMCIYFILLCVKDDHMTFNGHAWLKHATDITIIHVTNNLFFFVVS